MKLTKKNLIKIILFSAVAVCAGILWWDVRKVDNFCKAIDIGLKVEYLPTLAKEYDVVLQTLGGISSGKAKSIMYAVAPITGGKRVCSIEHDFEYVQKTSML